MTGIPGEPFGASQPAPGGVATDPGPNPIEVGFAGTAPQRRLTVAFRIILLIPQYIVLFALGVAAAVVAFIGWWGALFTGRLPEFAAEFLTGVLRWNARVTGYHMLLTDVYPPFSFEDADYPVRLATRPGRLNRFAVFFRIILAIPAYLLAGLLVYGAMNIVLFVTWLIVLVNGRMPDTLHRAYSAVLRYLIRYDGYVFMLTGEQPFDGLFGDSDVLADPPYPTAAPPYPGMAPSPVAPEAAPVVSHAAGEETVAGTAQAPAVDTPAAETPAVDTPAVDTPAADTPVVDTPATPEPGEAAAAADEAPPAGSWATPSAPAPEGSGWAVPGDPPWRLALTQSARTLVGVFMALGVLVFILEIVLQVVVGVFSSGVVSRVDALNSVQSSYGTLTKGMLSFTTKTQACQSSPNILKCVTTQDIAVAGALDKFATDINSINMPSGTMDPPAKASALAASAERAAVVFRRLATAKSATQYQSIALSSNLQGTLSTVSQDYVALGNSLSHP